MPDWKLTELNSRLAQNAYRHTFDQPNIKGSPRRPPVKIAVPALPPRPPNRSFQLPALPLPENMGNVEGYFRETPGALSEAFFKILGRVGVVLGLALAILTITVLTKSHPGASGSSPVINGHEGKIGIMNPAWVEQVAFQSFTRQETYGYFASANILAAGTPPPAKYIYVSPKEAQADLDQLVKIGYLYVQSGTPDIQRDWPTLKKLGYVVD